MFHHFAFYFQSGADLPDLRRLRARRQGRGTVADARPSGLQPQAVPGRVQRLPSRPQHLHLRPGDCLCLDCDS